VGIILFYNKASMESLAASMKNLAGITEPQVLPNEQKEE